MQKVIIHGHFYQPPRENPWTGVLEKQNEAAPYHDWNARICHECYEANAYSPLLDASGRVERYFNNYEHISFNVGPTLLSWLEQEAPHVYEKILEGDRISRKTRGCGNAVAQVYNHIILPLASEKDRRTQIIWSLEDFKKRFNRDSRGLWLSETAINPDTAEEMVRCGIEYTILSPQQAEKFIFDTPRPEEGRDDAQLWRHPWSLNCPSGELRIYFYHPGLSAGISFSHLLRDADSLYGMIKEEIQGNPILAVATDGEIYGHHEALGNMGLSALLAKIEADPELENANFSQLTDTLPAAGQVILKKGEDGRGSSWSCSHGVSRWYKDCGCTTGSQDGWNQQWRAPLRSALETLNRKAGEVFSKEIARLMPGEDPDALRNTYIELASSRLAASLFLRSRGLREESKQGEVLRLLEGQKFALYMFTSCGWFFADITGVEPRQNLLYAARLLDLYGDLLPAETGNELLAGLSQAVSNIPGMPDGAALYAEGLNRKEDGLCRRAASFILSSRYKIPTPRGEELGASDFQITHKDNEEGWSGKITLSSRFTGQLWTFRFRLREREGLFQKLTVCTKRTEQEYTVESLNPEERRDLRQRFTEEFRRPRAARLPAVLRLYGESHNTVTTAVHSILNELLILMGGGDAAAWDEFKALLLSDALRESTLPEKFTGDLYRSMESCLNHAVESTQKKWQESFLEALPQLRLSPGSPEMPTSLSGRIYDLYLRSAAGKKIREQLSDGQRLHLRSLLNLSPGITL